MLSKIESKLKVICSNYINGNRREACLSIRKLNKVEVAQLLINSNYLRGLVSPTGSSKIDFEDFILQALESA